MNSRAALILALLVPLSGNAEFDANLSLASHYLYRGLNYSGNDPALQGMVSYTAPIGIYGGIWAGNVEFPRNDVSHEVDYFLGYQRRLNNSAALDITLVRYTYGGASNKQRNYKWTELQITALLLDQFSLTVGVVYDWLDRSETNYTSELTYRYSLTPLLMVDTTIGYVFAERVLDADYQWAELGVTRRLGPLQARLAYTASANTNRFL